MFVKWRKSSKAIKINSLHQKIRGGGFKNKLLKFLS